MVKLFDENLEIAIFWQYPKNDHLKFSVKLMSKWNFDYGNRFRTMKTFRKDINLINLAYCSQMVWNYLSDDAFSISAILNFSQNLAIFHNFLHSYELTIVEKWNRNHFDNSKSVESWITCVFLILCFLLAAILDVCKNWYFIGILTTFLESAVSWHLK